MAGVTEKSIDITLENDQLTIQGFRDYENPEGHRIVYSEYELGDYYRSFTLGDKIDREKIEAKFKNGVLRLTLPKAEKAKQLYRQDKLFAE